MRIFGFELKRAKKPTIEEVVNRQIEDILAKKDVTWGKLWETVRENSLLGNKVIKPYEQVSNVYKAVKAIADNIPQAELAVYDQKTNEEAEDDELMRLLHRPNPRQSGADFLQFVAGYYALYGEAFILKVASLGQITGARKLPAEMWCHSPTDFQEVIDKETGQLVAWDFKKQRIALENVIHIKDFNPYNPYRGLPPTKPLINEIELDYMSMLFNKAFFDNDATPNFVLVAEKGLTFEQKERLEKWAEAKNKGVKNKFKLSVLDAGITPKTIASTHTDMEFIEQKRYTREEILGGWRVPKAFFNITEDLNYATFIGQMKIFWIYTMMPILRKIEEGLNTHLVEPYNPNIYFAFKLDNVPAFQEDFKEKVTTAQVLFNMGFTANEINQKLQLGFEEEDWRDYWWIGFGQVPADAEMAMGNPLPDDMPPDDEAKPKDKPKDEGKMAVQKDLRAWYLWKDFLQRQGPLEGKFESKIRRFFFEQRKRILDVLAEDNKGQAENLLNWGGENDALKQMVGPIVEKCVQQGAEMAKAELGQKALGDDILKSKLQAYLTLRLDKITQINNTMKKLLKAQFDEGIKAGETVAQLADRVRETYNMSAVRAKLIARTETGGGVNGGSYVYYKETGVEKKAWLTAGDEVVRESHRHAEEQGAIDLEDKFANGLMFPQDMEGDAGEVCNCRCRIRAVID